MTLQEFEPILLVAAAAHACTHIAHDLHAFRGWVISKLRVWLSENSKLKRLFNDAAFVFAFTLCVAHPIVLAVEAWEKMVESKAGHIVQDV